ncbi:hypothetical protein OGATHE_001098 [Ogataea polymorpha]|uniref:Uncharacterized protein n=1 Tax=Ogataea polymorpha TaxID=460523 RepID=A0A9P8TF81_9ASCO|nr:hypothetical protein OGATHE_001098 [Ogataea polymorpha]
MNWDDPFACEPVVDCCLLNCWTTLPIWVMSIPLEIIWLTICCNCGLEEMVASISLFWPANLLPNGLLAVPEGVEPDELEEAADDGTACW